MQEVLIKNLNNQQAEPIKAKYCNSYFSRLRGLMFYKEIDPQQGLLLVFGRDSKVDSGIHMFFMNFDIAVFWINSQLRVVDRKIARKWRSILTPAEPAQYVLETLPVHYEEIEIGDKLEFEILTK